MTTRVIPNMTNSVFRHKVKFGPEDGGSDALYVPPKRWYLPTSPHGVTTQKTNIDIFTSVRISDLSYGNLDCG
jgi:hypothetical protein